MAAMQTVAIDPVHPGMERRHLVYGLLGRVFERPLSLADLRSLSAPPQAGVVSELKGLGIGTAAFDGMLATSAGATRGTADDIREEFDELFRSQSCISSHACGWTLGAQEPHGPAWERALDFYRAHGVAVRSDMAHLADHVSFELYVAALLAGRVCESCTVGQDAHEDCDALRDLLDYLLLPWMPDFLQAVEEDGRARFYRQAARATREFLEFDWHCLDAGSPTLWA